VNQQNLNRKPVEISSSETGSREESEESDFGQQLNTLKRRQAVKRQSPAKDAALSPRMKQAQHVVDKQLFQLAQEVHAITQGQLEAALRAAQLSYKQENKLDVARAINLYYEQGLDHVQGARVNAGGTARKIATKRAKPSEQPKSSATTSTDAAVEEEKHAAVPAVSPSHTMGVLPITPVPEWGLGQPPEGGPHYATFKQKLTQFERYRNQTANRTTVTFKSCILSDLRPTLEGRCGLPEHCWNDVRTEEQVQKAVVEAKARGEKSVTQYLSGWGDEEIIAKLKETMKPPRVEDWEIKFELKKLKHSGPQSELAGKFETWASEWLAMEREAQSQGVEIEHGRMKKLFETAVRFHPAIERIIKGTTFTSCKEWYGKISKQLEVQASYASQLERDDHGGRGDRNPTQNRSYQSGRNRESLGGSHVKIQGPVDYQSPHRPKFQDRRPDAQSGARPAGFEPAGRGAGGGHARANHMGGNDERWAQGNKMESMTWQPSQRDGFARGRGSRGGRGRASSAPPFRRESSTVLMPPGRGDRFGAAKGEQFGNRQPINNPANESPHVLTKGPYWHENGDLLRCISATCGQPFDTTVFCQGCGWLGHSREWCYKSAEPGFNPTGYWSVNRKGQPPLPGKNGQFRGARGNMMDASEEQGSGAPVNTKNLA
jgi:hypothetical protein